MRTGNLMGRSLLTTTMSLQSHRKKRRDNTSKKKLARQEERENTHGNQERDRPGLWLVRKGQTTSGSLRMRPIRPATSHGFVLETVVTPGNVHDSVAFDEVYDKRNEDISRNRDHCCRFCLQDAPYLQESI